MAFGEVFFFQKSPNGLIFGMWIDMGKIKEFEIFFDFKPFCGPIEAKFCPFFDFSQKFDLWFIFRFSDVGLREMK